MKSTRHIVKPIKGLWNPKRSVWFKHNKDFEMPEGKVMRERDNKRKQEAFDNKFHELFGMSQEEYFKEKEDD